MLWLTALIAVAVGAAVGYLVGRRTTLDEAPAATSGIPADDRLSTSVVEEHRAGVVVADSSGRVRYRNQAARDLAGTHVGVLIDDAIERHVELCLSGDDEAETLELYGPPKKVVTVESHPQPDGGAVVFVTDVTEAHRLDQARTDFVANISHELKTPVGALLLLAETALDEADDDTRRRLLNRLVGEADRATRTLDDLMQLSQIELDAERVDDAVVVADLMKAAIERVGELATTRGISISTLQPVDQGANVPPNDIVVLGDRRQLVSAIGNLVENAVKYSDDGGQVQIRTRRTDSLVEIAVIDQGIGIPARDLGRIFERFYRVDRGRSRTTGGTGLGLSIVRHVANNHGGNVLVSSTEGVGSTFVFQIPRRPLADDVPNDRNDRTNRNEGIA